MADLPSSFSFVNDVEVGQDTPVTENLFVKLGSNDNYLRNAVDAEIAARIAGDNAILGAGPYQTNTQLKSRLDSAKDILLRKNVTRAVNGDLGWPGGNQSTPANIFVSPSTNFLVVRWDLVNDAVTRWIRGNSSDVTQANNYDTGEVNAVTKFTDLVWDSTFAQFFFTIRIWEIVSV